MTLMEKEAGSETKIKSHGEIHCPSFKESIGGSKVRFLNLVSTLLKRPA